MTRSTKALIRSFQLQDTFKLIGSALVLSVTGYILLALLYVIS